MNNFDYRKRLEFRLSRFRKPGDPLRITRVFVTDPNRKVQCGLCGWPSSSTSGKHAGGLTYVYVLTNMKSNKELFVGRKCAINSQLLISQREKNFSIGNLNEIYEIRKDLEAIDEHDNFIEEFYNPAELIEVALEEEAMVREEYSDDQFSHLYFEDDEYVAPEEKNVPAVYDEYEE